MEERLNRKIKFCKVCGKVVFEDFRRIHPECLKERQKQNQKKWYKKHRREKGITTRYHSQRKPRQTTKTQAQTLIIISEGKARTFKLIGEN